MTDWNEMIEEIELDCDALEEVEKAVGKFDFPAVTITDNNGYFYFNQHAKPLFKDFNRIKFFTTPEYVIFSDAKGEPKNSFSCRTRRAENYAYYVATYPAALKEKKLKKGSYKLYKCKHGFAFKRYEPLSEEAS